MEEGTVAALDDVVDVLVCDAGVASNGSLRLLGCGVCAGLMSKSKRGVAGLPAPGMAPRPRRRPPELMPDGM